MADEKVAAKLTSVTIDEYISHAPARARRTLEQMRVIVRAAAPDATEGISYGVAYFKLHGKGLVSFGAAKNHCGFYAMSSATIEAHAAELTDYETSKGTVRFPFDEPLPEALITRMVKARIAENEEKSKR
jgi:uncharacterized protein YdhG (YjbR/CyaY superfamily)